MTGTADVNIVGTVVALLLVGVGVAISRQLHLGLERRMLVAAARLTVQLLLVGGVLTLVVGPDRPLVWSWLWLLVMTAYAADVLRRRVPEVPRMWSLALTSFGATLLVTVGVLFGLRVFPLESRAVVPVTGMIIGNSLVAAVLIARRVVEEFRDKRPEIDARLALGQPARLAARPYLATAARMALVPNLEMAKATGIVLLPGALVGLILSGVDPLDAVLVQAVVMYMMFGTVTTTAAMMGYGLVNRLFTDDHRLRWLERPAGV
jgi:putative ABC transport system permease protein